MTMPLHFDKSAYLKVLRDAGVPPDLAEAHADAIETGLAQPIVLPSDLAVLKADMLARMDELKAALVTRMDELKAELVTRMDELKAELVARMDEKFSGVDAKFGQVDARLARLGVLVTASLLMSAISVALNCVILMRL